jgi:hypothetical protein
MSVQAFDAPGIAAARNTGTSQYRQISFREALRRNFPGTFHAEPGDTLLAIQILGKKFGVTFESQGGGLNETVLLELRDPMLQPGTHQPENRRKRLPLLFFEIHGRGQQDLGSAVRAAHGNAERNFGFPSQQLFDFVSVFGKK